MGRLLLKNREILFEYDAEFLKSGLELSPFKLPLRSGIISSEDRTFEGLFGVFNDSLPDGWGRLLLDRKLIHSGINVESLSPLDRLCFVGAHGMGALSYEPENPQTLTSLLQDLDEIDYEIQAFQEQDGDAYVDDLLTLNGSSTGARPKVLMHLEGKDWLIKFRSRLDLHEISTIEYAYHLMAQGAGLVVPEAKLFSSRKGSGFFGVERFDRKGNTRIHMHTAAGLLHTDHRTPSLDYEMIMKATLYLTQNLSECEKQFRHAVFNVLAHNRDDHSKNFSFLMDDQGIWTVSPAYDLTFSSGPNGEHSTMVMGHGQNPKPEHLLQLANIAEIGKGKALGIIEEVHDSIRKWPDFAEIAGVSKLQTQRIHKVLEKCL